MPKFLAVIWYLRKYMVYGGVMSCSSNLRVFVRIQNTLCAVRGHKLFVLPHILCCVMELSLHE